MLTKLKLIMTGVLPRRYPRATAEARGRDPDALCRISSRGYRQRFSSRFVCPLMHLRRKEHGQLLEFVSTYQAEKMMVALIANRR